MQYEVAEEYLESFLRVKTDIEKYPNLEIKLMHGSTHTAELAAAALGTTPGQIAKTLCFLADGEPILIVACGDRRIDTKKFGRSIGAKKVRMADSEIVKRVTGFSPGGVCPFALLENVNIYLDNSLKEYDITFIAAGTPNSALPISAEMLEKVTSGSWIEATK